MGNKTISDRKQYVVKANDLIRKTRYDLTTQQQKIVLFCISKIKPNDLPDTEYEIEISDICDACGITIDGTGYYYRSIKNDLVALTNRLWVEMPDKSERTVSWIGDAQIIPLSGKVYITFHKAMAPYLFDLRQRYTQYQLENVLVFKGKYTIRLYEILRSYTTQSAIESGIEKEVSFSVSELRNLMQVNFYPRWADFNRFIIKSAVDEINFCNDEIHIEYDTYKSGRNVSSVNFIISSARARQMLNAHQEKRKRLNSGRKKRERKPQAAAGAISGAETAGGRSSASAETVKENSSAEAAAEQRQKERAELAEQMKKAEEMLKAFEKKYSDIGGAEAERNIAAEMREQLEKLKEMSKRLENVENVTDSGN